MNVSLAYQSFEDGSTQGGSTQGGSTRYLGITFSGVSWAEVTWIDFLLTSLTQQGIDLLVDTRIPDGLSIRLESQGISCPEDSTFTVRVWVEP